MKISKKIVIIVVAVLVLLIGGGIAFATNTPTARAQRQLNLGNKYLQEGKYQEAILAYQKVIQIEPKNIPARLGLGNAYIATSEFAKAETVLKEVTSIDPNNIPAREELFKVYIKEGDLDAANSVLNEITMIDPQKDMKQYNSDLDLAKAISLSKASYDLGIKQMNDKQYLEAVESFQKVIKEDTERYDDAQTKIGECKKFFVDETLQKAKDSAVNKDHKTALDLLEQILKVDPNNDEALKLKSEYSSILQQEEEKKTINNASTDLVLTYTDGISAEDYYLKNPTQRIKVKVGQKIYFKQTETGHGYNLLCSYSDIGNLFNWVDRNTIKILKNGSFTIWEKNYDRHFIFEVE